MIELDDTALASADMAFIESPATSNAGRLRDAIRAYLYTIENAERHEVYRFGVEEPVQVHTEYPSWPEIRNTLGWNG
ncbi:hypothetical protein [Nocardia otitidiscaviarum]|uniref:hypothetical protein n=1 Tax=Nocardia otitidiscaviarum TaxID=1823 RepID=UPI002454F23C|nr:hypothetical protein [Nocardia otitidiscaviarum]